MSNNNKAERNNCASEFVDPVFCENGQWFFWNEVWAWSFGPYDSYEEAHRALVLYVEEYL